MKDYKYERVEGMTVGQVVDAAMNGAEFVEGKQGSGFYVLLSFEPINVKFLQRLLDSGSLLKAIETPWWEKHVGSVIMVTRYCSETYFPIIFKKYREGSVYPFMSTDDEYYSKARPLTQAEKDSIITEG